MADAYPDIFFSYSRADAVFVDRLEADFLARGYGTWVDRRRLEGGVDWEREINAAIAACDIFLIVLSPSAVVSPHVRQEFAEALRLSKRLIPILYRGNYATPTWLAAAERIQQQNFTDDSAYAVNLKRLIYAVQDPHLNLNVSSDDLYARALAMRAVDLERAAVLLQHLIDREPTYFGGQAQRDLAAWEVHLYTSRAARLRAQAEQAHQRGQYGVEAASLEALVALGERDERTYAWASEYLPIARQNRAMLGPYGVIQDRIADNDSVTARTLLQNLWQQAPYFRDPAGIAPTLGLRVPMTYEEAKERRLATEERDATVARLRADALARTAQENEQGEHLAQQLALWETGADSAAARSYLKALADESSRTGQGREKRELLARVIVGGREHQALANRERALIATLESIARLPDGERAHKEYAEKYGEKRYRLLMAILFVPPTIVIIPPAIVSIIVQIMQHIQVGGELFVHILFVTGLIVAFGWMISFIVYALLLMLIVLPIVRGYLRLRAAQVRALADRSLAKAQAAGTKLLAILQSERDTRIQAIQNECDHAVSAAEARLQQQLAEIERRYPQG